MCLAGADRVWQGKKKYEAWGKVKDMKPEEAQKQYVEVVKKLTAKYN